MGGKSSAPSAPDYTPIAASDEAAAKYQYNLGEDQLNWAKQENAQNQATTQQIVNADLQTQQQQDAAAAEAQQFYDQTYKPIETNLANEATSYASPQRQELEAGRAGAAVDASFDGQRAQATNRLQAMGIDPSQARASALDSQMSTVEAASRADAMNNARLQTQNTGLQLETNAVNTGRGYPGSIANTFSSGTSAGSAASGATNSSENTASNALSSAANTYGSGTASNNAAAGALTQGYNASLNEFNANQNTSSGFGALLGAVAGGLASNPKLFADGGPVPASASPSGGINVDDIPARLNAGEFVIPRDVAAFEGHRKLQGIVDNARKRMGLPVGGNTPNNQPSQQTSPDLPPGSAALPAGASAGSAPPAQDSGTMGTMPLGGMVPPRGQATGVPPHMSRHVGPMRSMQSVGLPV